MPTQHSHRLTLVVPAAKVAAVVTWLQTNIGANSVPNDLGPGLNATGLSSDPVTFRWCCGAFTDPECKAILVRICNLASVTPPTNPQWNGWSGAQKRAWLAGVRDALFAGFGVWVMLAQNDGQWDSAEAVLASRGLKVIQVTP